MLRFHHSLHVLVILLVMALLSTASCKKEEDIPDEEPSAASASDDQLHFFHAWMADCINDLYFTGETFSQELLVQLAKDRIEGLISNDLLISTYGKTELVWGPQLIVNPQPGGSDYTSGNLMYCLKSQAGGGDDVYYVGIAGTNSISFYDWFTEDMDVSTLVEWSPGKGKIAEGTYKGLENLKGMKDPDAPRTLETFLSGSLVGTPGAEIHVSGHSLGGALTQAYAAYLRSAISNPRVIVSAWVYAGPTAGDQTFAQTLYTDLGHHYYAFNNKLDVVPHAWQQDNLKEICSLYQGKTLCSFSLNSSAEINGVVKYLEGISSTGGYTEPSVATSFSEDLPAYPDCTELVSGIDALYLAGKFPYKRLNKIHLQCNPGGEHIDLEEFGGFITFMLEMERQHNTAYFNHFVPDQNTRTTISAYMPGGCYSGIFQDTALLGQFLGKVETYLKGNQITHCDCP